MNADARRRAVAQGRHLSRTTAVVALAATLLFVTCDNESTAPTSGTGSLAIAPVIEASASLNQFTGLTIDQVRVEVFRPPEELLVSEVADFDPEAPDVSLNIQVPLQQDSELLDVVIQLLGQGQVLFSGVQQMEIATGPPDPTQPPIEVPVTYVGPGTNTATITVLAPNGQLVGLDSIQFDIEARDVQGVLIPEVYVAWSVAPFLPSPPQGSALLRMPGEINADGLFRGDDTRGFVEVTATTPNGVTGSLVLPVFPSPATLASTGGDGQSGPIGSPLSLPIEVQVLAADQLPVPGIEVTFAAATGGGSVSPTMALSDAQGLAQTTAILGGTEGAQTFTATVDGVTPATFNATGTALAGITRTWTGAGDGVNWSDGNNWNPAGIPTAVDTVVVPTVAGVTLDVNATVGSMQMDGSLSHRTPGITLTLTGDGIISSSGLIDVENTTFVIAGTLTIDGGGELLPFGNSTLSGGGQIIVQNNGFFELGANDPASTVTLRDLDIAIGALGNPASASWRRGDVLLENVVIDIDVNATFSVVPNDGAQMQWTGAGTRPIFLNRGTTTFSSSVTIEVLFDNDGSVSLLGSPVVTLDGGGTSTGTYDVPAGAVLALGATHTLADVTGAGQVHLLPTSVQHSVTGDFAPGDVLIERPVSFQGTFSVTSATLQTGGAAVSMNTVSTATVVDIDFGGGQLGGGSQIDVSGTFNWPSVAPLTHGGIIRILAGATFTMTGGTKNVFGTILNEGTTLMNANMSLVTGALIDNRGTFDIGNDLGISLGTGGGQFSNAGLMEKTGGIGTSIIGVPFTTAGDVSAQSGTLAFTSDLTLSGTGVLEGIGQIDLSTANILGFGGTLRPAGAGTIGVLTIVGTPPLTNATIELDLAGTGVAGTNYDQLAIVGTPTVDGTVVLNTTFTPLPDDQLNIIDADIGATFAPTLVGAAVGALQWDPETSGGIFLVVARLGTLSFVNDQGGLTHPSDSRPFTGLGSPISPNTFEVWAYDFAGTPINLTDQMTVALQNNPTGATLVGNTSEFPDGPTGFFFRVGVDREGTGYTMSATAPGMRPVTSPAFDIVPGVIFAGDGQFFSDDGVLAANPDATARGQLTSEGLDEFGIGNVRPRWSPDRSRITYTARAATADANQLHILDVNTGAIAHPTSANDTSTFNARYDPTGTHVAFVCGNGSSFSAQDVCVIDDVTGPVDITLDGIGDGAGKVVVTDAVSPTLGGSGAFAWDPTNGDLLAVVRDETIDAPIARVGSRIFTVGFDGSNPVDLSGLLAIPGGDTLQVRDIDWAADGSFLAFSAVLQNNNRQIYRIDRDGSSLLQLTTSSGGFDQVRPVISPDGSEIVYLENNFQSEAADWQIMRIPATGGTPVGITPAVNFFASERDLTYDWSPDGSQIVVVPSDGTRVAVYVILSTTTAATFLADAIQISPAGQTDVQASWRP